MNGEIAASDHPRTAAAEGRIEQEWTTEAGRLQINWSGSERLAFRFVAEAPTAIREVGLALDLPAGDIHSLLGGPYVWDRLAPGQTVSFDSLEMAIGQFYLLEFAGGCLWFGRRVEQKRDMTTGWLERTRQGWRMIWKWQPQAPFARIFESQAVEFECHPDLDSALASHRRWMERQFKLVPKEENPKTPEWLKKCRLALQINVGETIGAVVHDYYDIIHLIEDLHLAGVPEETILYIPDYNFHSLALKGHHGPICATWPENPLLGGREAFIRMLALARKYRYHILPHASVVLLIERIFLSSASPGGLPRVWVNPEWAELEKYAVRDIRDNPLGWPPTAEECPDVKEWAWRYPYTVRYLNQAYAEVQRYYVEGVSAMMSDYGLDAMYFDSMSNNSCFLSVWNHPANGAARAAGEREIMRQLYARHGNALFSGEGCTEETADLMPLWQWRTPIVHQLMGPYIYTFAHTHTASPIPQRYSETGGISPYDPDALRAEIELTRRQPNNIPPPGTQLSRSEAGQTYNPMPGCPASINRAGTKEMILQRIEDVMRMRWMMKQFGLIGWMFMVALTAGAHERRINTWLVNGTYADADQSGLNTDYLVGEASVAPGLGAASGGKLWRLLDDRLYCRNQDDYVDLFTFFMTERDGVAAQPNEHCVAYAHCYAWSPVSGSYKLLIGASDGLKAWVNGSLVATLATADRQPLRDQNSYSITLNAGWNRLLVKSANKFRIWGFYAKIADAAGNPASGLDYSVDSPAGTLNVTTTALPKGYTGWPYIWLTVAGVTANYNVPQRLALSPAGQGAASRPTPGP